jgi:hypothetical protein
MFKFCFKVEIMKTSHSAVRAFAQFVLYIFDTASLDSIKEAAIEACAPHRLKEAATFFVNRGFDSESISRACSLNERAIGEKSNSSLTRLRK